MNALPTGQFYGQTNQKLQVGHLTLTDTEYTHPWVDWHYHENAYFTFILQGKVLEGNRKERYTCTAGSLLFHHWQEAHYNQKPEGYTRGFHVELNADWFQSYEIKPLQGSIDIQHPQAKRLMYNLVKEAKRHASYTPLAMEALLIELFGELTQTSNRLYIREPVWVKQLRELLHDAPEEPWTLNQLAEHLALHPVYLCREMPRYFNCRFGEYLRMIRLQKALPLLLKQGLSLTHIALDCGFADQSHFIRSFRNQYELTPFAYRKLFVG
ncbi:helix-turn-helix transcriptional regulator [Siphonobacter curvatus]|uniref:AraC family transcriptional regulator n=1 Tax=Siphonobacter curvatus TaxID=2094562 RepID=A0A2S7IJG2_9BACT|nr:helix-turn-helix domain-containing protein [Siphonobacter curvatus]PQA56780.1 AraC family transcriptional regulator [Siphonobacter curvatus]